MSSGSVLHMLQRVLKRAGLERILFHDLRHTFATLALRNGVDVKTVSGMLGHYSAGFSLDTYAHVTTAAQRNAANAMGNIYPVLFARISRMGQKHGHEKSSKPKSSENKTKPARNAMFLAGFGTP